MTSKKKNWKFIVGLILLITLVLSIVYAAICLCSAPVEAPDSDPYAKVQSDYLLMLVQCFLALIVMLLPSFIQHKFHIDIPNYMHVLFFIFLYCAVYLGEVRNFYYLIPFWDLILHTFSGAMLGALGFSLVSILMTRPILKSV